MIERTGELIRTTEWKERSRFRIFHYPQSFWSSSLPFLIRSFSRLYLCVYILTSVGTFYYYCPSRYVRSKKFWSLRVSDIFVLTKRIKGLVDQVCWNNEWLVYKQYLVVLVIFLLTLTKKGFSFYFPWSLLSRQRGLSNYIFSPQT